MGKERGKMRKEISSLPTASILLFELNSLFRACSSSYRIYSFEGVEARSMENLSFCCAANEKHTDDDNAVHVPIILMNKQQIIEKLVWSLSLWSAPATLLSLTQCECELPTFCFGYIRLVFSLSLPLSLSLALNSPNFPFLLRLITKSCGSGLDTRERENLLDEKKNFCVQTKTFKLNAETLFTCFITIWIRARRLFLCVE